MNEQVSKVIGHKLFVPAVTGVISFGVGAGVGFLLGRRSRSEFGDALPEQLQLNLRVDRLAELQEISESVEQIRQDRIAREEEEHVLPPVIIPAEVLEAKVADVIPQVVEEEEEVVVETVEIITHSVFAEDDEDWDLEKETAERTDTKPYILHKDEFYSDELGYHQQTLNYYEGDNIMCDEEDTPVYNHENIVGSLQFGHGSDDPNVFYVRNDRRKAEYEIINNPGLLYSLEVLGLEIEPNDRVKNLRHSAVPKFRRE